MAQRLMPVVGAALGLSRTYFDAAFSDATAQLRCNHYPPVPGERRTGAHTDSSFMTFLPQVCMRARPASIVALFCLNVCAQAVLCW
jgi:isopenicillin N synthase-like dioxygenase